MWKTYSNQPWARQSSSLKTIRKLLITTSLGEEKIKDTIHFFQSIPGGLLLFRRTEKYINILSSNIQHRFENSVQFTANCGNISDLIQEFSSVFGGKIRTMDGKNFCIKSKDNRNSLCANTILLVRYAHRDKLKDEIALPKSQGMNELVLEPIEWCVPTTTTPKTFVR